MLTFFEFYETLLGFVLYKLYGELGIRYPLVTATSGATDGEGNVVSNPSLHPTLGGKATSVLAANLSALKVAMYQAQQGNSAADAIGDALQQAEGEEDADDENAGRDKKASKAERKKQKKLMLSIDEALKGVKDEDDDDSNDDEDMEDEEDNVPIAAPLREALEAISDGNDTNTNSNQNEIEITDPEAKRRHQLFHNLTFFLSREVPRGYLELVILSYGGQVGWEGQDSPIAMDDPSITHHVVDRPTLLPSYSKLPKSRDYIQPQWVMDSANFNFVLPIDKYGVGKVLPPHLSPWVDDKEEGYVPKYKEEVERLKNGEVLESDGEAEPNGHVNSDEKTEKEEDESMSEEEVVADESNESDNSESEEEDNDEDADMKAAKKIQTEVRYRSILFY